MRYEVYVDPGVGALTLEKCQGPVVVNREQVVEQDVCVCPVQLRSKRSPHEKMYFAVALRGCGAINEETGNCGLDPTRPCKHPFVVRPDVLGLTAVEGARVASLRGSKEKVFVDVAPWLVSPTEEK